MRTSRRVATALTAMALALWVGSAQAIAGQVTTAAARPHMDRSATYRQALTEELAIDIDALRATLFSTVPREEEMAERTSAILTTVAMLGVLSPRTAAREGVEVPAYAAQALQGAAERLDEAARSGDRAVALGHLQVLVGALGAFQASFGPVALPPPAEATVNID